MSSTQGVLVGAPRRWIRGAGQPPKRQSLRAVETRWALAFMAPYAAVFVAFVIYPVAYALWLAGRPSLFVELVSDSLYRPTVINTLFFVGIGVNVTMFAALLLSGFFLRPRWWIRLLLIPYLLPWLIATVQACLSFHWMLIDQRGLLDGLLSALFGFDGPRCSFGRCCPSTTCFSSRSIPRRVKSSSMAISGHLSCPWRDFGPS